ncbi:AAA family ATPase [Anaeromyxobacter paludicola]|uniref:Chromosome segregation protein SMC n=1 Tax=Anaeromyxobacter paludicola TaxID=2918171 RepID=A0ABM7XBQ5_9BACT|nr:AAA family ATPase [Anaeromyxobacter paludicola]BDG09285.1 chromosome segregation protein SMC [Anaeromyxobacter paludicola]
MTVSDHIRSQFLTRVVVRNFRSIGGCDVSLDPLTFLVGPNGSGKSNFLDALRLIADSLRTSLDHALRDRGGINEVRRRSSGHPTNFGIRLEFRLSDGLFGAYAFEVGAQRGSYEITKEECTTGHARYVVRSGEVVVAPSEVFPPASSDRLYLVNAAGLPAFRPVFDALSRMGFYSLNPDHVRALQPPDKGDILARDGSNLASVLERLEKSSPQVKTRVEEYLRMVVPGIEGVSRVAAGHMETLQFRQSIAGAKDPWRFPAINMSDGTLRALGLLVALFQSNGSGRVPLVGIEEPEVALHPAAAGVLRDALRDASRHTQVLVTSHSPELLDDPSIPDEAIIAVASDHGRTRMARLDDAGRSALRERLYTAGELLRVDQLRPDETAVPSESQLHLFESDGR